MLVELEQFKKAVLVCDTIINESDKEAEAWYLLAFSHFNLKKLQNAKECCKNVKEIMLKYKIEDLELQEGAQDLMKNINSALGKTGPESD